MFKIKMKFSARHKVAEAAELSVLLASFVEWLWLMKGVWRYEWLVKDPSLSKTLKGGMFDGDRHAVAET